MTESASLFSFENVTARMGEKVLFTDLSFGIKRGEHWAIVGPGGSGKSALLETIAGQTNITGGRVLRPFYEEYLQRKNPADPFPGFRQLIGYLPAKYQFRNLSNTTEFFYQQRYNAAFSEDAPTVEEYLQEIAQAAIHTGLWDIGGVSRLFQLEQLLKKQLIKLSNGETKRLRLAAVLLKNPAILLLDNPLVGLDVKTRENFDSILEKIAHSGISVILATHPKEIPKIITHAVLLENCSVKQILQREDFDTITIAEKKAEVASSALQSLLRVKTESPSQYIVRLKNVTVRYGEHLILDNISWEVKPGERWALQGPNGAGKSTLLSLINGDNPQAYANDIEIFDRKRGSGESIWDIKKRIGFVSPELLQYFHTSASCWEVVASGFTDSMGVAGKLSEQHYHLTDRWLKALNLDQHSPESFTMAPPAIQRMVLILRALVKNPPLLILDEPCQGLDAAQQARIRTVLDSICSASDTSLIYVTHYEEELPACVNKVLKLEEGRAIRKSGNFRAGPGMGRHFD